MPIFETVVTGGAFFPRKVLCLVVLTDKLSAYEDRLYSIAVINDVACDKYPYWINDSPVFKYVVLSHKKTVVFWKGVGDSRMLSRTLLS